MACEDDAKDTFLNSVWTLSREELDARNHIERPKTCEERVAVHFDDKSKVCVSKLLPGLHDVFAESITVRFDDVPGKMTPDSVKTCLAGSCTSLIEVVKRWERSGNGFGQMRATTDRNYGAIDPDILHEEGNNASPCAVLLDAFRRAVTPPKRVECAG